MKIIRLLLIFVPVSLAGEFIDYSPTVLFALSALAIIPLAGLMGEATEEISFYTGPKIGGFLNATFGNATELIIAFFAMRAGLFRRCKSLGGRLRHRKHTAGHGRKHAGLGD